MRVIGLMSGTSADGVDAALVEWGADVDAPSVQLLAYDEAPFDPGFQQRIHRLAARETPASEVLREFAALDVELGEEFARAAARVTERAGLSFEDVDAIASHGQTVAHHPELRATLQIGDPSVIAERTGCVTVADFRARDLAAGGEGAPLAPFFHRAAFASRSENRLILNLGGIANVTWLPAGGDASSVVAFDVGPANALIDGVVARASDGEERMDRDGVRAAAGRVDRALLGRLLADPFLERPPPKSTGREHYGKAEADALFDDWVGSVDDLVATLLEFTVECVAHSARTHLTGAVVDRVLVGGGGARNPTMMAGLARVMPKTQVEPFDAYGVPADAAEAIAFSLLGRNALLGIPNHLPQTTGASHATVLGEVVPGIVGKQRGHLGLR